MSCACLVRPPACASRVLFFHGLAWLALAFALPAVAQTPDGTADQDTPTQLKRVVITATRSLQRVDQSLAETTVIERAQIEQATGRSLPELLSQQSGVQFTANGGGPGKATALLLRGLESRHTLLLIDGVRYGSATQGTPSWENIPLDSIERIEIVRGPMSSLYGSDAVGGVVQVFTHRGANGVRANASVTAGSRRTGKASAGLRFGEGDIEGAVSAAHNESHAGSATNTTLQPGNHHPDDDGFRQHSGNARLGWRFAPGWRADASLLSADGVNHYDDGPTADSRLALHSEVLSLQVAGKVLPNWRSSLRLSRATDESDTQATASASATPGQISSVQPQFSWENTVATPWGTALLLAERLQQKVSRPGTPFAVSERVVNALALGLNGQHSAHTWQMSLRHDRNSQFGRQGTGSLGYGFDLTPAWRAAASYGTSFVQPSFNQLYFPGFGNPALLPEEGRHTELSLRWAGAAQQLRLAWFDNRIRSFITSGPNPGNVHARIDGVSLGYEFQAEHWNMAASLEHTDPRNDSAGTANFGKQLPRRSKDSLKLAADTAWGAWRAGAAFRAFSDRYDNAANTLHLGGFGVLDLAAHWSPFREWTLGLALHNAGNKTYETVRGFNQPGREIYLSLRYRGM